MGCDIHLYVEVLLDDEWVPLAAEQNWWGGKQYPEPEWFNPYEYTGWYHGRDYTLFGQLAGVRREELTNLPQMRPTLPDDISPTVDKEFQSWSVDAHSPGWYTVAELQEFDEWESEVDQSFLALIRRLAELGPPDQVRIVFWFDN